MAESFSDLMASTVKANFGGASILSSQNDVSKISWVGGLSDPGEMLSCGYLPEARRRENESDADYQVRLLAMDLPTVLGPERFGKLLQAAQRRAGLAMTDGQVAMFSALLPGWHELGTVISQAATSEEALRFAHLAGWDVQKVEQFIQWKDQQIATGSFAVIRGDNGAVLTKGKSVGSRYTVVSNEELLSFMDQVVDGVETRYETAGALGQGERIWLLAKMPGMTADVAQGDSIESCLLLTAAHDGSGAIIVQETSERVVCNNSYRRALKNRNGAGLAIRHSLKVAEKVKAARQALGLAKEAASEFLDTARLLGAKPMIDPTMYFQRLIDKAVPVEIAGMDVTGALIDSEELAKKIAAIPELEEREFAEVQRERAKKVRGGWLEEIQERYANVRNNGMESIQGTAWAALNAVTEATQHGTLLRYKGSDRVRAENRFESIIDGRAAELADVATELAMSM